MVFSLSTKPIISEIVVKLFLANGLHHNWKAYSSVSFLRITMKPLGFVSLRNTNLTSWWSHKFSNAYRNQVDLWTVNFLLCKSTCKSYIEGLSCNVFGMYYTSAIEAWTSIKTVSVCRRFQVHMDMTNLYSFITKFYFQYKTFHFNITILTRDFRLLRPTLSDQFLGKLLQYIQSSCHMLYTFGLPFNEHGSGLISR